ncbi:MAG: hypothetical protein H0V24_16415 [Chloroflexia bacterium]|nr:hypothetical protein [Chloroflexia bacterium]
MLALAGAFILLRLVFKLLSVPGRVWTGGLVYWITDPLLWPLTLFPASDRAFLGEATLKEVTAVALILMVPLVLAARAQAGQD